MPTVAHPTAFDDATTALRGVWARTNEGVLASGPNTTETAHLSKERQERIRVQISTLTLYATQPAIKRKYAEATSLRLKNWPFFVRVLARAMSRRPQLRSVGMCTVPLRPHISNTYLIQMFRLHSGNSSKNECIVISLVVSAASKGLRKATHRHTPTLPYEEHVERHTSA
jgi:hypothetical protein